MRLPPAWAEREVFCADVCTPSRGTTSFADKSVCRETCVSRAYACRASSGAIGRVFGDQPAVQTVLVQTSAQTPGLLQTEPPPPPWAEREVSCADVSTQPPVASACRNSSVVRTTTVAATTILPWRAVISSSAPHGRTPRAHEVEASRAVANIDCSATRQGVVEVSDLLLR
jgi:hypothetical protein